MYVYSIIVEEFSNEFCFDECDLLQRVMIEKRGSNNFLYHRYSFFCIN